ncbi:kinase-like domain-containing protein [Kickxella alabastrina]|uniref:kinase-like domain-containing protein n=1 Tax=Kickxella alabastrina TaxID=61397 RepID=UPI0022206FD4|nr:kinase-like domain-containing protein [Kickxella alabastrina]KAI7834076.1 kinase-like domain-containing protein [Kickxella alabastrina]
MQIPSPFDLLKGTVYEHYTVSAIKLTGGLVNHVWRVSDKDGCTVIVKYAGSTMSAFPENAFSTERTEFEVRGLALLNGKRQLATGIAHVPELCVLSELGQAMENTPGVHIPQLLHYNSLVPFMVLEDIGNLKPYNAWYAPNHSQPPMVDLLLVSQGVGEWLARLHAFGFENYDKLEEYFVNLPARQFMGTVFYDMLCRRLAEHKEFANDGDKLITRVRDFCQEINEPKSAGKTLLFGDLWSASVLFNPKSRTVNLLDLEFFDVGFIYNDVGHFVAHLLPLYYLCNPEYNPNTDPCPESVTAFLNAYKETLKGECPRAYTALVSPGAVKQSTIFFGMEISRDVLTGYWCRCSKGGDAKDEMPLTCVCADELLPFARKYIMNTSESIFNVLI